MAAVDGAPASPVTPGPARAPCENCGEALSGEYCAACGQSRRSPITSVRAFASQLLDDAGNLDIKLLRSLRALFFRPGHLTREYLDGRRVRYTQPIQLYLLSAAVFFLTASFRPILRVDPAGRYIVGSLPGVTVGNRVPAAKLEELAAAGVSIELFGERFVNAVSAWLPAFLVASVALFSLALYALCFRRERRYLPHAVFALHWTAFYLVVMAAILLLPQALQLQQLSMIIGVVWLVAALRRVHGDELWRSVLKAVALMVAFLVVLLLWVQSAVSIGMLVV